MNRVLKALARNDIRGIRRDTMLMVLVGTPVVYTAGLWFVPALTTYAATAWNFDLVPYHSLIVSAFGVLGPAMVLGSMSGLLLLDDKDQHTLTALRVTPVPVTWYSAYRAATTVGVSTVVTVAVVAMSGLARPDVVVSSVAVGVLAGLLAVVLALLMAGFAANKVEGIAIVKALGLMITAVPVLAFFFLGSPWEWAFAVLPSYWPARALWSAMDGGAFWLYTAVGLVYNSAVALLLVRMLRRRFG